jgi:hypothetical protein
MALFDSDDGVTLTQEGDATRLSAGRKNYLFRKRLPEEIRLEYEKSIGFVRDHFRKRWDSIDPTLTKGDFEDITQEIALHHMYYYVVNEFRVRITKKDLDHPQTRSSVWEFMRHKFRDESEKVSQNSAIFLGLTPDDFSKWLTGWKHYLEMR